MHTVQQQQTRRDTTGASIFLTPGRIADVSRIQYTDTRAMRKNVDVINIQLIGMKTLFFLLNRILCAMKVKIGCHSSDNKIQQ